MRPAEEGRAPVTASEFAFLSLGLVLGVFSGAALVEIVRSRPPTPREIRLTVTPDSIPRRRAATLAEDAFVLPGAAPATGGPGDRRLTQRASLEPRLGRTFVRSPLPPAGAGDPASGLPLSRIVATRPALGFNDPHGSAPTARYAGFQLSPGGVGGVGVAVGVAVPVHREPDPQLAALRAVAARSAEQEIVAQGLTAEAVFQRAAMRTAVADPDEEAPAQPAVAETTDEKPTADTDLEGEASDLPVTAEAQPGDAAGAGSSEQGGSTGSAGSAATEGAETPVVDCGEARRVAEERCSLAGHAREQADAAHTAVRSAQRVYDAHMSRAEEAAAVADPRAIRAAKERAQYAFRQARAPGGDPEGVEAAARAWLDEINRVNRTAREAATTLLQEREAAHALVTTIERLTVEADAARIAAETAESACVTARQAVADCEEAAAVQRLPRGAWPTAPALGLGGGLGGPDEDESELEAAFTATGAGEPAILRLLRGDRVTLARLVDELGGKDADERRRWQLALAGLTDALVARAIEASYLTFPVEHTFWGMFTLEENRAVASALSSLGYRFDGLGGWADDRVPSPRDMSLAVGYAGLDPMRTRHWPREQEMRDLFREVSVAADEYLASAAGGLTLGELVSVLGRRADALADLWNEWGRVRPLLLSGG